MVKLSKQRRAPAMAPHHHSPASSTSTLVNDASDSATRRQQRRALRVRFKLPTRFWKRARTVLRMSAKRQPLGAARSATPAPGRMSVQMAETAARLSPRGSVESIDPGRRQGSSPRSIAPPRSQETSTVAIRHAGEPNAPVIHVSCTVSQGDLSRPQTDCNQSDLRGQLQQANTTIQMLQKKVSAEEMLISSMRKQIKCLELSMQATNERYLESLAENRSLRRRSVIVPPHSSDESPKKSRRNSITDAIRSRAQSLPPVARSARASKQLSKETTPTRKPSKHAKSNSESAISRLCREDYGVKPGTRTRPQTSHASTADLPNPWDENAQRTLTDSINELLKPQRTGFSEAWSEAPEFPDFSDCSPASVSSTVSCSPVRTPRDEKPFDVAAFNLSNFSMATTLSSGLGISLPSPTSAKEDTSVTNVKPAALPVQDTKLSVAPARNASPTPSSIYSVRSELPSMPSFAELTMAPAPSPRPYVPLRSARRLPKSPRAMSFSPEPVDMTA